MNRIDESKPFKPVNIAVLTVSDTRTLETDKSGDTLAERINRDGHVLAGAGGAPLQWRDHALDPSTKTRDWSRAPPAAIEQNATRFLDKAVPDSGARAEIAEELSLMRGMAPAVAQRAQPLTVALADTHPGNFIVDRQAIAWFVDLEKVHVGSPAIDLAHATLATSTLWHPDVGKVLSLAEVQRFYTLYLEKVGRPLAANLEPWLLPMRRLTWLRTTLFMARWRVQTRSPRDAMDPTQWSDAGLEPAMKAHIDRRIDQCFRRDTIQSIRAEWMA
jgi:hypothetical protein